MINFLESLRNVESRFLNLGFLALVLIGSWIDHWFYFACLILVATILATLKFLHDKKWIASADKYIRIIVEHSFMKQALGVLAIIVLTLLFLYYREYFKWLDFINVKPLPVWTIITVITYYGDYFDKFVQSIKSFDEGIQLPGRKSEIIPWKEIHLFTNVEDKITISTNHGEHEFIMDPEDYRYTRAIIADWKLKNGRKNLGI